MLRATAEVEKKALALGAERMVIDILQQKFVDELIFRAIQRNAISEDRGRQDLLKFASENNIPVSSTPKAPWSQDDNLAHCSYESGILEKPDIPAPKDVWTRTVDPLDAPDAPTKFSITFKEDIPVKLDVEGGEAVTGSL
ncbi:hypothetical protein ACJZ2D_001498 [Fusarium nematophilum]